MVSDEAAVVQHRGQAAGPAWHSHKGFFSPVEQNDAEATKAAALHSSAVNSTKAEASAAPAAASAPLDDGELKKLLEKCKRQQAEMDKLAEENRQLKVNVLLDAVLLTSG